MSLFRHEFHEDDEDSDEYGTPPSVVRPLARAVGGFDVDPASGAEPSPLASTRFDEDDDGLSHPWHGTVWLNPPFSEKRAFVEKAREEVRAGRAETVVTLLPVDTSTALFHEHVAAASVVCFREGRLSFFGGDRNPNFGVLLAVYGDVPELLLDALDREGTVFVGNERYQRSEQPTLVEATNAE